MSHHLCEIAVRVKGISLYVKSRSRCGKLHSRFKEFCCGYGKSRFRCGKSNSRLKDFHCRYEKCHTRCVKLQSRLKEFHCMLKVAPCVGNCIPGSRNFAVGMCKVYSGVRNCSPG